MLTYTIAIRTLGTSGELLRQELLSIGRQTVAPEQVLIYIAEGHARPEFTVGAERYIYTRKGMMAQRLLPYEEVTSDCLLLLDDDVYLAPDSAEKMLKALEENRADCVAADTFQNHKMSTARKWKAALSNWVVPHTSQDWAFRIHCHGSFSYLNNIRKPFYWSQSAAGPASLWRTDVFSKLHWADEFWLDRLEFPYGEDLIEFYKLYKNGYRLGVLFNSGIEHRDGRTSSRAFRYSDRWMYVRTMASFIIWWRTCFRPGKATTGQEVAAALCYLFKTIWLFCATIVLSALWGRPALISNFFRGLRHGWKFVNSKEYRAVGTYIIATS